MKIKWKKDKEEMAGAGKKEKKILTPAEKKKRRKRIIMGAAEIGRASGRERVCQYV